MTDVLGDRITKAVIDTEPLLSVLVINYVRQSSQQKQNSILGLSRISRYLANDAYKQEALFQLFDNIPVILTTSHVIAEIQGLQTLPDEYKEGFWLYSMDYLSRKNLDEKPPVVILDMNKTDKLRGMVSRIGPTDTGLIELARQEDCTLLTEDKRTLARSAWEMGVDCRIVEAIVS